MAKYITNGLMFEDKSLAASFTSDIFADKYGRSASLNIQSNDGTHVGTFSIYGTNDPTLNTSLWELLYFFQPLTGTYVSTVLTLSSGVASHSLITIERPLTHFYISYTATSGTGTATARLHTEQR